MRRSATELSRARADAAVAELAARERMARDLHDSAQQRLIALRIHLGLARERLPQADRAALDDLGSEVDAALRDIRSIARGDVAGLEEKGLGPALAHAAGGAGIAVTIDAEGVTRHAPAIERAAYYTVVEALQNAAKHGGGATSARVFVRSRTRHLVFAVTDDGPGMSAEPGPGSGIEGMRSRVRGVGGRLRVRSARARGTCVIGVIPAP